MAKPDPIQPLATAAGFLSLKPAASVKSPGIQAAHNLMGSFD
jgi:hypothetical protein